MTHSDFDAHDSLVAQLAALTSDTGVTVAQLAIAWLLTPDRLTAAIEADVPPDAVAGERDAPAQKATLDSAR
jgi:hypothetical protein